MTNPLNPKFGVPATGDPAASVHYAYPNLYDVQETTGPQRLILAPAAGHIDLLGDLAAALPGPFGILYVLTLSRRGEAEPGRYQSPYPVELPMLRSFLEEFSDYLEGDARHHLWVMSLDDNSTLIYDRHNVIYGERSVNRIFRGSATVARLAVHEPGSLGGASEVG